MYVVSVEVKVKPEMTDLFIRATLENAQNTRQEPGNVRFDLLQVESSANEFLLYEAYHTADDFVAHQQTEHYLKWREVVADMMAQPRRGVRHHSLFFGDSVT